MTVSSGSTSMEWSPYEDACGKEGIQPLSRGATLRMIKAVILGKESA